MFTNTIPRLQSFDFRNVHIIPAVLLVNKHHISMNEDKPVFRYEIVALFWNIVDAVYVHPFGILPI